MAEVMESVVNFISRTNLSNVPAETVSYTKKLCLSQLAGLVGGTVLPEYLSAEEVMYKFRSAAEFSGYLSDTSIERVGDLVFNLEDVDDVSEIMDIISLT